MCMPELELILSVLSVIGIGGIASAFFTYIWKKRKERQLKENELKERRYLCTLLLMYTFVRPKELDNLKQIIPAIKNQNDLKRELQVEWVNSWIFASDNTITAFKKFLDAPSEETFAKTVLAMKKELWNKGTKLPVSEFSIKSFLE